MRSPVPQLPDTLAAPVSTRGWHIQRLTILVPRQVGAALTTLASVSDEPVDAHVHRAIAQYLDGSGRRALVAGLARRARDRHRRALDALSDR